MTDLDKMDLVDYTTSPIFNIVCFFQLLREALSICCPLFNLAGHSLRSNNLKKREITCENTQTSLEEIKSTMPNKIAYFKFMQYAVQNKDSFCL